MDSYKLQFLKILIQSLQKKTVSGKLIVTGSFRFELLRKKKTFLNKSMYQTANILDSLPFPLPQTV